MVSPRSIRERKRYAEDPEFRKRKQASIRRYFLAHREELNARRRERRRTDPKYRERHRNYRRYGLTPGDYHKLLARQGGVCAICKKKPDGPLGVDHCHSTRQVRGLLCSKCNVGLGHYDDDDTDLVLAASAYLEASRRDIDGLSVVPVIAAELAERLRQRLELALRAAFALRRQKGLGKAALRCFPARGETAGHLTPASRLIA